MVVHFRSMLLFIVVSSISICNSGSAFLYAAPAARNSLPPTLQQMSNTDSFTRHLKTFFTSKLTLTSLSSPANFHGSLVRFYFGFIFLLVS